MPFHPDDRRAYGTYLILVLLTLVAGLVALNLSIPGAVQ